MPVPCDFCGELDDVHAHFEKGNSKGICKKCLGIAAKLPTRTFAWIMKCVEFQISRAITEHEKSGFHKSNS